MSNIMVVGLGYVGSALSVALAKNNNVLAIDINKDKVDMLNKGISPVKDKRISEYLDSRRLDLRAEVYGNLENQLEGIDYVFLALPTNFDEKTNYFDTSVLDNVIGEIRKYSEVPIVIKSTVPIGYTQSVDSLYGNVLFSPEFLREGYALEDLLYPSRVIVSNGDSCFEVLDLLTEFALKEVDTLVMSSREAESVKLFANTYLAMRVAFFNELDTYAELNSLDANKIISGISLDERIGTTYNDPSFGYGGYCLPKDTKQLKANYEHIPQNLISAVIKSNETRKEHIARMVRNKLKKGQTLGVYRLVMKEGFDNFRESLVLDVLSKLASSLERVGIDVKIYEPTLKGDYGDFCVTDNLEEFKEKCDLIIANRLTDDLVSVQYKVYSRSLGD